MHLLRRQGQTQGLARQVLVLRVSLLQLPPLGGLAATRGRTETATYVWNAVFNFEDEKDRIGHMVIFAFTGDRHIQHVDIVVLTGRVSSMSRGGWSRFGSWVSVLDKRNGVLR